MSKVKTIIFDIDGVLVSTKELHEIAILSALRKHGYEVTHEQHKVELDGLPTKVKLAKLGIPPEKHQVISDLKQELTFAAAEQHIQFNPQIAEMFGLLGEQYNLGIASNAIRRFCELVVSLMKLPNVGCLISNEEAKPKPDPDMYLQVMKHFGSTGQETVICEDSKFGLAAAFGSGAYVLHVPDPSYLNYNYVNRFLKVL